MEIQGKVEEFSLALVEFEIVVGGRELAAQVCISGWVPDPKKKENSKSLDLKRL